MSSDVLWEAVRIRDRRADDLFVYAVASTRIYCRPSCPSRRPRRDRVCFYPTPASAETDGYRACRRCRPGDTRQDDRDVEPLTRLCQAIARRPDADWSTARLAAAARTTIAGVRRLFRSRLGITPRNYVAACRRRILLAALRNGQGATEAIYAAGYGSPSRVYGGIQLPGMTPATYGRGGAGARLDWRTVDSRAGRILVSATSRGLCFVEVGRTDAVLLDALRAEFPNAEIAARPSTRLRAMADTARTIAEASAPDGAELPIDIRGTAFQWRVWRALTRIPRGETRSYAAIAAAIGRPMAARAVARACATNPLSLVVPCHRVVRSTGAPGGYRWGIGVKQGLLARERRGRPGDHP